MPKFNLHQWQRPPIEYSQTPFWFWNDALTREEIVRQLDDFKAHGVDGFVIHPRIGLPQELGFFSPEFLDFVDVALREAKKRGMRVVLYDEGMYPSGSAAGKVVAENPAHQCRGLTCETLAEGALPESGGLADRNLVAVVVRSTGQKLAIYDQKVDAVIRGLHYLDEETAAEPREEEHPAADLLNPNAVNCFIRHVYDRYYTKFGHEFGRSIAAIFTDEPDVLGRLRTQGAMPGTSGIMAHVNRRLGYDFTPHLPALWFDDEPEALRFRREYLTAIKERLNETYFQPLFRWCSDHGIALTGHPAQPGDIGHLRYFHVPGQDIVWRHIEPDKPSAIEGSASTQAKGAASAASHFRRPRNLNEFAGAYGAELTFDELKWLARWLLVRGCNWLAPHAFYYSVRGPRRRERPPDVGPHSDWWDRYRPFADETKRLSWLNAEGAQVCAVAILCDAFDLPWRVARICFEHQIDFNYLELSHLGADAEITEQGINLAGYSYAVVLVDGDLPAVVGRSLEPLARCGRMIRRDTLKTDEELVEKIDALVPRVVRCAPAAPSLRARRLRYADGDALVLFNEAKQPIAPIIDALTGSELVELNPSTGLAVPIDASRPMNFEGHQLKVIVAAALVRPAPDLMR